MSKRAPLLERETPIRNAPALHATAALIEDIYSAALKPGGWQRLCESLSRALGDAAVVLVLNFPETGRHEFHSVGLEASYLPKLAETIIESLPYSNRHFMSALDRFVVLGDEFYADVDLEQTDLYRSWMRPQGLPPIWPMGHTLNIQGEIPAGGLSLFRQRSGDLPFGDAERALCNELVPHLSRAVTFYATLDGVQRERLALGEVLERLPTGVVLLDAHRRAVISNGAADRIVNQRDGFGLSANGPYASDARENARLQELIADALDAKVGHEFDITRFLLVSRPSARRPYPLMVTRLLSPPPGSRTRDAVIALFISDPDVGAISATQGLETLYALTPAEADLVRLLTEGHSLEESALARGVTINTARSHLKHIFAKTNTNRQGELVRLVLTGVGSIRNR
jgi:DNA-binding CsgD family transcriptional regulator